MSVVAVAAAGSDRECADDEAGGGGGERAVDLPEDFKYYRDTFSAATRGNMKIRNLQWCLLLVSEDGIVMIIGMGPW